MKSSAQSQPVYGGDERFPHEQNRLGGDKEKIIGNRDVDKTVSVKYRKPWKLPSEAERIIAILRFS